MKNKSLFTHIRNASLIGATVVSCWLTNTTKLLALPSEVIVEKLRPIPVFTIADSQGTPLIAPNDDNGGVSPVFISKQDANNFLDKLKKDNPDLAKQVQVIVIPLGQIFELTEANAKEKVPFVFAYVPTQTQVEQAKKLNTQYQGGVPLFVAMLGNDQGSYFLPMKQNDQEFIPLFFEKQQVQQLVDDFKKAQPDLASSIKIDVVTLEGILEAFKESDDEVLTKIVLLPSKESIDFLRANVPNPQK
ncbi:Tic22 family protein [Geminocystis herdmanii]|uniref:Tic22 family protein n=1 Tax=Geminocystis herdmanii TaxID=669359 RepID=UPI00034668A0|nr:Tic22 family protein [Geminocystis herdmanii]